MKYYPISPWSAYLIGTVEMAERLSFYVCCNSSLYSMCNSLTTSRASSGLYGGFHELHVSLDCINSISRARPLISHIIANNLFPKTPQPALVAPTTPLVLSVLVNKPLLV